MINNIEILTSVSKPLYSIQLGESDVTKTVSLLWKIPNHAFVDLFVLFCFVLFFFGQN